MSSSFNEIGPGEPLIFEQGEQEVKSMLASNETILGSCEAFKTLPVYTYFGFIAVTGITFIDIAMHACVPLNVAREVGFGRRSIRLKTW